MNLTHDCSSAGKGIIDEGKPFQACKHLANIFDVYRVRMYQANGHKIRRCARFKQA